MRLLFSLRNPVVRAYSEYLNKRVDKTVMRYLHKRIDNKMDKELSEKAPPFKRLVDDVARAMATCRLPNRTFSMMDEYDKAMERDRCYVNPFVGEGRYARYLKHWLEVVPASQMLLLNFDEWTEDPEGMMRRVFAFLQLKPYAISIQQAHNTHLARSVHVHLDGASNISDVADASVADALNFRTHCILHEFFAPYQLDLDELLKKYGYALMRWDTASKGGRICPRGYQYWPASTLRSRRDSSARGSRGAGRVGNEPAADGEDGSEVDDSDEDDGAGLHAVLGAARRGSGKGCCRPVWPPEGNEAGDQQAATSIQG